MGLWGDIKDAATSPWLNTAADWVLDNAITTGSNSAQPVPDPESDAFRAGMDSLDPSSSEYRQLADFYQQQTGKSWVPSSAAVAAAGSTPAVSTASTEAPPTPAPPTAAPQAATMPDGTPVNVAAGEWNPNAQQQEAPSSSASTERFAWFPVQKSEPKMGVKHVGGEEIPVQAVPATKVGGGKTEVGKAELAIYAWSPEELAEFRDDAIQYGYVSKDATFDELAALWRGLINESANYLAAGKHMSPFEVMVARASENEGKGPGGQPITKVGRTEARGSLESAMESELGRRIAPGGAVGRFQGAASAEYADAQRNNETFSTAQAATDYVREHHGAEAGSRAALHYYDLIVATMSGGAGG